MRGDIELMGVPQSPPLGKTLRGGEIITVERKSEGDDETEI